MSALPKVIPVLCYGWLEKKTEEKKEVFRTPPASCVPLQAVYPFLYRYFEWLIQVLPAVGGRLRVCARKLYICLLCFPTCAVGLCCIGPL